MSDTPSFLTGGGDMGVRIRAFDWAATPLGPPRGWPVALRSAVALSLHSAFPTSIYWGPAFHLIYNDAWSPIPGPRHPHALGHPAHAVWGDIWHIIGPQLRGVIETRAGFSTIDEHLPMQRFGRMEETYWDYSFTPIVDEHGDAVGVLNQGRETTRRVLRERADGLILAIDERIHALANANAILDTVLAAVGQHLDAGRVGYAEIDRTTSTVSIERCWSDARMAPIAGRHALDRYGHGVHASLRRGEAVSIDDSAADPRTADPETRDRYAAMGVAASLIVPMMTDGVYAAALFVHDDKPRQWMDHHVAMLRTIAERIRRELARARAETALRDSEMRHRLIFEQANDFIFTADLDQRLTAVNPAAAAVVGSTPAQLVGRTIADFLAPADFARSAAMLARKLADGGTTRYELEIRPPDRTPMRWEVSSALATDRDGVPVGLHGIARDVTEQRANENRQQLLINELNHRVKNTLAIVQGLALQSFKPGIDPDEGRLRFQARLAALASAHDLLTRAKWEGSAIAVLAVEATAPYAERIAIAGPDLVLPAKAAVSLVLALHELCTNAAKYGALSTATGRVEIGWWIAGDRFGFVWRETGGPAVTPPTRKGFGLRMIERALAADLDGETRLVFDADGLRCEIAAPLPAPDAPMEMHG